MSEELSESQIAELEVELLRVWALLQAQLQGEQDTTVVLDQQKVGRVSRIDAIQQNQMDQANRAQAKQRLQQVAEALAAIAGGDFGYCRQCDEAIGYRRLKARPETPLCLSCQEKLEAR